MSRASSRIAGSSIHRFAALALAALALGASQEPKGDPAAKPGEIALFDGKSLDGWKVTPFARSGEVVVEDGAIVMKEGRPMTGITSTRADLPKIDYELSYEAQRLTGRDFFAAATFPVGDAFLTLVNGGWGGSVTGLSSLDGADASENDSSTSYTYKDKTWYRFRIHVTAASVRAWVDDKKLVDARVAGRHLGTRIEVRASQPLGFATWETGGAVRAIRIRQLTEAEIRDASAEREEP